MDATPSWFRTWQYIVRTEQLHVLQCPKVRRIYWAKDWRGRWACCRQVQRQDRRRGRRRSGACHRQSHVSESETYRNRFCVHVQHLYVQFSKREKKETEVWKIIEPKLFPRWSRVQVAAGPVAKRSIETTEGVSAEVLRGAAQSFGPGRRDSALPMRRDRPSRTLDKMG